jgi:Flp pilus assembly protein TadD
LELFRDNQATGAEVAAAFAAAMEKDPKNPGLLGDAGHAAWARGDHARARKYLHRGMNLDPNQANLRALSGLVAMAEGHFEEAEQHFDAASKRDWHGNLDGHLQAMTVWAACLVKLNRPEQAALIARNVLEYRPDWPGPRYTLGYALAMLGRRDEATVQYRELIARCPSHPLAGEARKQMSPR